MIYLDYAANTPVDEEVLSSFAMATRKYIANPNSLHPLGLEAKNKIDEVSNMLAKYFDCSSDGIIYTSGSSESNNLVIKGLSAFSNKKKIIISSVEHSSIVAPCNYLSQNGYDVSVIDLNEEGMIDLEQLEREIDDNTLLVSICTVDSELGTIMPIKEISDICKRKGALFHTDATQAIGKVNIDYSGVDFITFAPHKFFGLNGFGVLLNVHNIKIKPLIHGGKSTTLYRSGTPVIANVVALDKALNLAMTKLKERQNYLQNLNSVLRSNLQKLDYVHINSPQDAIFNTINISLINKDTKKILVELDQKGIYLSTTTACSLNDSLSKSVLAITGSKELASNTIRISISHLTTYDDIQKFLKIFREICD